MAAAVLRVINCQASSDVSTIHLAHNQHHNIAMQLPAFSIIWAVFFLSLTVATASVLRSLDNAPVLHFTLFRRGGKFAPIEHACDYVNMTYLAQELEKTESRFNLTQREVKGNKLVRKAKSNGYGSEEKGLTMGEDTTDGIWYISHSNHFPPQRSLLVPQVREDQDWRPTTGDRNGLEHVGLRLLRRNHYQPERQQI